MRRTKRVLLSLMLLTLFATHQVSISMFTHVHYVNGVMIAHSHPNNGKHTHTQMELVVIGRLSSVQMLEPILPTCSEPLRPLLYALDEAPLIAHVAQLHKPVLSLRAPPAPTC